jgi:hypothetical protein
MTVKTARMIYYPPLLSHKNVMRSSFPVVHADLACVHIVFVLKSLFPHARGCMAGVCEFVSFLLSPSVPLISWLSSLLLMLCSLVIRVSSTGPCCRSSHLPSSTSAVPMRTAAWIVQQAIW